MILINIGNLLDDVCNPNSCKNSDTCGPTDLFFLCACSAGYKGIFEPVLDYNVCRKFF